MATYSQRGINDPSLRSLGDLSNIFFGNGEHLLLCRGYFGTLQKLISRNRSIYLTSLEMKFAQRVVHT